MRMITVFQILKEEKIERLGKRDAKYISCCRYAK